MSGEDIKNFSVEELGKYIISIGEKPYRAKQVISWLYQKNVSSFEQMTDLSFELRKKLEQGFFIGRLNLKERKTSQIDRTQKFLFQLEDGNLIETVLIPGINRLTGCLSTQVGCRFRCRFCASGEGGFIRNLKSAEMVNQLQFLSENIQPQKITNVVFMGMGEPLDNYTNLIKAMRIINHPHALNIGARKITISTCGLPQAIKKLAREKIQVELSVSLHAAIDELRSKLMPVNKLFPLEKLIPACRQYTKDTNRIITFEYVLIKDMNDRQGNVKELIKLLDGLRCKINLITFNPFGETKFYSTAIEKAVAFQKKLKASGIMTTLRQSKGEDIKAACGQLRLKRLRNHVNSSV